MLAWLGIDAYQQDQYEEAEEQITYVQVSW